MNLKKTKTIQYPFIQKTPFGAVNIYRQNQGRTRFFVTWVGETGRRRAAFDNEAAAHQRAEEIIDDLRKGVSLRNNITSAQAARLAEYDRLLSEHNVSMGDAVRHFVSHLATQLSKKKDALDAVNEYLNSFDEQSSRSRNYSTVRSILYQFGRAFGKTLDSITLKEFHVYLRGVSESGRTRNNHLGTLKTFYKWAQKWGYMPDGDMVINKVDAFKEEDIKIEIFTPDEMRRLLAAANDDILPALVVGAFAGVRTAEIGRLHWEDIRLDEGVIMLDSAKTKTKRRRMPLISDNLKAWLVKLKGDKTGLIRQGQTKFHKDRNALCKATGIAWKDNGLRKSYISYRMAQPDADSSKVAKQCGNSADMIEEYYKGLVTPSSAEEWFSIFPSAE
jgi:integrase